ncbi:MAG: hypothetical protein FWC36_00835 [Spirochaetes bacterium]|nr:hypothetical protein [Spirochaetota bacterium]
MNYDQKFDDDFRELFTKQLREDEDFGKELWSALANVSWYHESDLDKTDCGHSFRSAGALIASMLCYGNYMDWYCSAHDGVVSEYIANAMASKGWNYEILGYAPKKNTDAKKSLS